MSRLLQRLNVAAICLLGGVLASPLVGQVRPGAGALGRTVQPSDEWMWPKTLQVYPPHSGDPVRLVRITKDGKEVVAGTHRMPEIAGDVFQTWDAVKEWLSDVSFTLKSQTSKSIVSVGIAVVFPARRTDLEYGDPHVVWCGADAHCCDGGCPELIDDTLHWGRVPAMTASGLEARYRAEAKGLWGDRVLLQGKERLRLAPGREITLSLDGRVDGGSAAGMGAHTDPGKPFSNIMNGIVWNEGIEEARYTEPCEDRANSKTGCAFAEVSRFNIGVDIVYFEDGTIWGNYGYGYALPNPDGIFTRVDADHFPGIVSLPSGPEN